MTKNKKEVLSKKEKKNSSKSKGIVQRKDKVFQGISKINRFNILFVDLQFIFTILTIICVIWYFFNADIWHVLQFVLGITLIVIGYNNKIIYNRPKFAYIYYAIGILLMVVEILVLLLGV